MCYLLCDYRNEELVDYYHFVNNMNASCGRAFLEVLLLTTKVEAIDGMEHHVAEETLRAAEGARGGTKVAVFRCALLE